MKNKCIVLIEDNPDDIELTLRAFKKNNVANEIIVLTDGEMALNWLFTKGMYSERDTTISPILILLDIKLPKVDGLEVLKQLRDNPTTNLIPVIILTSSKEETDMIKGYQLRVNSYIRKPVDFIQFLDIIKNINYYWLILNESPVK